MLTMRGSATLKKPPGSASMVALTGVPPLAGSTITVAWIGNGPDVLRDTNLRFGSNSVISVSLSMRRPRNLLTARDVVPTPIGPAEVFVDSSDADDHFGADSGSLTTAKTSSRGRLIVVLTSAFAMDHPPRFAGGTEDIREARLGAASDRTRALHVIRSDDQPSLSGQVGEVDIDA